MAVRIGGFVELAGDDLDAADVPELMNRAPSVRPARGRADAVVVLHLRDRSPGEAKKRDDGDEADETPQRGQCPQVPARDLLVVEQTPDEVAPFRSLFALS
jgi:hypothetical protein